MPVSVVFGGQFGSEGKGKVAYELARAARNPIVVRVGGPNSGHTVIDPAGGVRQFRLLPTASLLSDTVCVLPAGSYIDPDVFLAEVKAVGITPERVLLDPHAAVITLELRANEAASGLRDSIGSTLSGTGEAVISRIRRNGSAKLAESDERLAPYVHKPSIRSFLRQRLREGRRVIIEGTQGFGLSLLHSPYYPNVTSRDTSAAAFIAEAGLSPRDVDDIVMVIRAFPIRVAGNSGPLPRETDWKTVTRESGYIEPVVERTTVTRKVRRVARFDSEIVRTSIEANTPTRIVLNHVDYVDAACRKTGRLTVKAARFVEEIERELDISIAYLGFGPASMASRCAVQSAVKSA